MADKKSVIIIKKKKGGAHAGHHGGAWKVAYADFVTAMMAFFLVLWLLGTDEETKSAIEHYFNHPNTPWHQGADPDSKISRPLGDQRGDGDNILNGMNGQTPDTLVEDPARNHDGSGETPDNVTSLNNLSDKHAGVQLEAVRFTIPERSLFNGADATLNSEAAKTLSGLSPILKSYKGHVTIIGRTANTTEYDESMARAVVVMHYLVEQSWVSESRITPMGYDNLRRKPASEEQTIAQEEKDPGVEFILSPSRSER